MSKPRFTVAYRALPSAGKGWFVFDRGRRITIPFAEYGEAVRHRDNIHAIYLRFGW